MNMTDPTQQEYSTQQPPSHAWRESGILELLSVIVIIVALAVIIIPVYNDYIDKAKVTIALDTLDTTRKRLDSYHVEHKEYPLASEATFSSSFFFTGVDSMKRTVFHSLLIEQLREDVSPVSYNSTADTYTFTVMAKDSEETIITVTPRKILH
jgi:Tfp pilus assembly protein PilE